MMERTTYTGKREGKRTVVTVDGTPLPERQDLVNHSPQGFEWANSGSGPSQLALAILARHFHHAGDSQELADTKALAIYHDFKTKLIATLPKEGWQLDTHVVADTVSMVVKDKAEDTFVRAMQLEVENRRSTKELDECYELLEQAAQPLTHELLAFAEADARAVLNGCGCAQLLTHQVSAVSSNPLTLSCPPAVT